MKMFMILLLATVVCRVQAQAESGHFLRYVTRGPLIVSIDRFISRGRVPAPRPRRAAITLANGHLTFQNLLNYSRP